jgi:hypothetical protein
VIGTAGMTPHGDAFRFVSEAPREFPRALPMAPFYHVRRGIVK